MGFDPQPNLWQCGPFSLKHALVMLGIPADEKTITRISGADSTTGADEKQLARAARKYDCDLGLVRYHDMREARHGLVASLRDGKPCLICAYEWSHWVTVVREEQGKFILLDSRQDAVLTIEPWRSMQKLWVYHRRGAEHGDPDATIYDMHPVLPRFRVTVRAQFSLAKARFLRQPENREFARNWDQYLEDLLAICRARTPLSEKVISLGEFLRRYEDMIVDQVSYWHGKIERRRAEKILNNLHFVADTYGLVIHEEDEKRAIAGIASLLTLWAGGRYGVSPFYHKV